VETDPKIPPIQKSPGAAGAPPPLSATEPPVIGARLLPPESNRRAGSARKLVAILVSLCLGLFLADALLSFADESLSVFLDIHALSVFRGFVFLFSLLMSVVTYGLMALTPMVPKRWFLPITLFNPVAALVLIPISTYSYGWMPRLEWGVSICQVLVGLGIFCWIRGGLKAGWPLVSEGLLGPRSFSWQNLVLFVGANVVLVPPAVLVYLAVCASLAVSHFTEGFMALRPGGLTVQARKYVHNDGRTIQLFPMSHIADSDFYQKVSESFPSNSVILMEGVTDEKNLLTNKISYKRMAKSLGLSEQHEKFAPSQGQMVRADVDVDQFSSNTISLLNLAMLVHSKGINPETLLALVEYPQPPNFEVQLFDDLVGKRNQHLLEAIHGSFTQSETVVVPWGALHMPGIAREIQKDGFRLAGTQNYVVVHFGPHKSERTDEKPK
jgi:hypothetical protein